MRKAAEVAQDDDLRCAGIEDGEAVEGGIDRRDLLPGRIGRCDLVDLLVEGHRHHAPAALGGVPAARMLGEDPPHDERRYRQEMNPVGELRAALPGELEEGLVHEGGRLEGVPRPLAAQLPVGNPLQLGIEEWKELLEGVAVACRPGVEQPGDLARIRCGGVQEGKCTPCDVRLLARTSPVPVDGPHLPSITCPALAQGATMLRKARSIESAVKPCLTLALTQTLALALTASAFAQPYVPLTDLAAPYLGAGEPGLYPGGADEPTGDHLAYGVSRAAAVTPRAADGSVDSEGLIGLVFLGMSNPTQEGSRFELEADRFAEHRGRLVIVNAAQGNMHSATMDEPTDPYWTLFDERLAGAGVDPDQVQVVWMKSTVEGELTSGDFPERMDPFRASLRGIVGVLRARCPNLQLIFLSSRIWTADPLRATFAYETAFAMKGLIQDQLDDVDGLASGPWIGWGPYLWADGSTPRADGFRWLQSDLESDDLHAGPTAEWKVANLLREHFRSHPLSSPWYLPADDTVAIARPALADAVVDPAAPQTVNGAGPTLPFDAGRRVYLKFGLLALGGPVVHAKLSLLVDPDFPVTESELHLVPIDNWTEAGITWDSAPAIALPAIRSVALFARGAAWSADVTAAVEAARLAGDPAISFALVPSAAGVGSAAFLSREGGEAPRLILTVERTASVLPVWSDGFESGDSWFWR